MSTHTFKTTLKCSGCLAAVKPALDDIEAIESWEVDLESPDKLLTVESDQEITEAVEEAFRSKGFQAEMVIP